MKYRFDTLIKNTIISQWTVNLGNHLFVNTHTRLPSTHIDMYSFCLLYASAVKHPCLSPSPLPIPNHFLV